MKWIPYSVDRNRPYGELCFSPASGRAVQFLIIQYNTVTQIGPLFVFDRDDLWVGGAATRDTALLASLWTARPEHHKQAFATQSSKQGHISEKEKLDRWVFILLCHKIVLSR